MTLQPLPIIAGPGSQVETESLQYLQLPETMNTYRAPILPEPEELRAHEATRTVLAALQRALTAAARGEPSEPIALDSLPAADHALLGQVLGEGEVSARVLLPGEPYPRVQLQEAIFAGVWRIIELLEGGGLSDRLEVGPLPQLLVNRARADGRLRGSELSELPMPADVMNAPAILRELRAHWRAAPHDSATQSATQVVNLTLLPLTAADTFVLDSELGLGSVTLLSRGYGNCRITSTQRPDTWRVVFYNSQDTVILETLEICPVPEVACAAPRDLADSATRLAELAAWIEGP